MIDGEVLDELYGVAPEEFVVTRTRLAKAAKDAGDRDVAKAIGELRKPTLAAWAINQLVRERPAEVERLLDVGRRMRAAQAELDVTAMRDLRRERETTLDAFTRATRFVADARGQGLSVAADAAVRATAVAVLADESAADALAGGALVRTLDYAGFGEVDLSDAVAATVSRSRDTGPSGSRTTARTPVAEDATTAREDETPTRTESEAARRRRIAALEDEVAHADQELARASLVEAEQERLLERATRRVDELSRLLAAAEEEARTHQEAAHAARTDRETAASTYADLRRRLDEASAARQ